MLHCHCYNYHLPLKQQGAQKPVLTSFSLLSLASPLHLSVWPFHYLLYVIFLSVPFPLAHTQLHTLNGVSLGLLAVGPSWAACNRAVRANKRQSPPFLPSTSHHSSSLSDSLSPSLCLSLILSLSPLLHTHSLKTGSIFLFLHQLSFTGAPEKYYFTVCCPDKQWQQNITAVTMVLQSHAKT